ncbi:hypothetical protein [Specibacter sp. RAF43]|uniref:hypothetical protein n=1 Tax=Specibacter sp. RAF43 TaxID=3233057 RepID=UPI003F9860B2
MLRELFGAARQGRRDDAELGKGVWRRAHDRFTRGLDRFHQMLEGIAEDAARPAAPAAGADAAPAAPADSAAAPADVYALLVPIANGLADLLPQVRQIALAAHAEAPSEGTDIPASAGGYLNDVHRELSRAGNDLAAAAEAVAMVRLGAGDVAAVERRSALVHAHVVRARELLTRK